jgi:hypothetical protein
MGEYYPSAKILLTIRFDEFEKKEGVKKSSPKVPATLAKGTKDPRSNLTVEQKVDDVTGATRWVVKAKTPSPGAPQAQAKSEDGLTQVVAGVIPKQAQLGANGIRQADTLNVVLRYMDLPIDPRTVRSCAIEYYLGTVSADEWQRGIEGETRRWNIGSGQYVEEALNVVPDVYIDPSGQKRSNLRFIGWVDKWEVELGDNEPTVKLECRDNTSMTIDQICPPKLVVSGKNPVDKAIAEYLANFPQMEGLEVEYRPQGVDIPILEAVLAKTAYKPKLGPTPTGGAADKTSVWDYLTDIAGSIGHNIRTEGKVVIIQRVRNVYGTPETEGGGRFDDPFQGRTLEDGKQITTRYFVYGRNIKTLRLNRVYKRSSTNIELRCYSSKDKTTLVERYPLKGDQQYNPKPGDRTDQKWLVKRVEGITDRKTLRVIAQSYYEALGRDELGVSITTKDLASFGGGNLDPDILDMKAGDPFTLAVQRDRENEYSSITMAEGILLAEQSAEEFLSVTKGFSPEFAKAYVRAYNNRNFQVLFVVRSLGVDWSVDEGVRLDIQGVNYIVIREPKLPDGEEIKNAGSKKGKAVGKK